VDNFNYDDSTVATLSVVDVDANRVVASRDVVRSEFPNARYRSFDVYFPAMTGTRYDFRVYWYYSSTAPRLTQRSIVVQGVNGSAFTPLAPNGGWNRDRKNLGHAIRVSGADF